MTGPSSVRTAADWLASQVAPPSPIIPSLCRRFGLTPKEAVDAIRLRQEEAR